MRPHKEGGHAGATAGTPKERQQIFSAGSRLPFSTLACDLLAGAGFIACMVAVMALMTLAIWMLCAVVPGSWLS